MRVALIDYGAGNLTSVRKALCAVGGDVFTPDDPHGLAECRAIVVPGVGHFSATAALGEPWQSAIRQAVARGSALLGICLGQQWLFEGSSEAPGVAGLGVFAGMCTRIGGQKRGDDGQARLKVPHVGWNEVSTTARSALLGGLAPSFYAYFTHSYAAPVTEWTVATTVHGDPFAAVVERDRVFGVQFHPEKSADAGLAIIARFLRIAWERA